MDVSNEAFVEKAKATGVAVAAVRWQSPGTTNMWTLNADQSSEIKGFGFHIILDRLPWTI